jgi:hypothetical protein
MIDEWRIGKNVKGDGHSEIEVLSSYLPGLTEKTHENPVSVADVPAKIQLPSRQVRRCYTSVPPYVFMTHYLKVRSSCPCP